MRLGIDDDMESVVYNCRVASALDRELNKLDRIVDTYCIEGKEDDAYECVEFARGYAEDFPQKDDIGEAIRLIKKVEKYIVKEGVAEYEQVRDRVIKQLKNVRLEQDLG